MIVNIHQAKTHLSRLIEQAEAGEEIIIARAGTPVARLAPVVSAQQRQPGRFAGHVQLMEGYFDPLPDEELAAWEGAEEESVGKPRP